MAGFFYSMVNDAIASFEVRDFLHNSGIVAPLEDKITKLELKINVITKEQTLLASSPDFHGFVNRAAELAANPRIGRRHSELQWYERLTDSEREDQQELASLRALILDVEAYGLWCAAANQRSELKDLFKAREQIATHKREIAVLTDLIEFWLPVCYPSGFEDIAPEFFELRDPYLDQEIGVQLDEDRDPLDGEDPERMSREACSLAASELSSYVSIALRPVFSKAGRRALDEMEDQHWQIANELHGNFWSTYESHFMD